MERKRLIWTRKEVHRATLRFSATTLRVEISASTAGGFWWTAERDGSVIDSGHEPTIEAARAIAISAAEYEAKRIEEAGR